MSTKQRILMLIIDLAIIANVAFLIHYERYIINKTIIEKQRPLQLKIDKLQLEIKRIQNVRTN